MFKSVLVANRGEIAVRVIAACQEMGIRAIAVYSDVDRDALHTRMADEAYPIGAAPAQESYLNIGAILAAARAAGAQAIHPGYGFLSENAEFAEACTASGIAFIGPPADAIRLMGSKTAAKRAVEASGVPTVPGYAGASRDTRTLEREAKRIGYPIMIKAAAGGGGKGMRVVREADELVESLDAARREASAAFGDDSVFLERLIEAPRHIEFQIVADRFGNTIHLGERECSIQRRHQKIIEESPSVALTPELRAEMGAAAVRAARSAGYVNAGTCEFLLDRQGRYYFLEMNTRLQVEHPVTELVTGRDLVRMQLQIASGEPLALAQSDITPRGHAIEARLYAEDPANGFLPSTGRVLTFSAPHAPGVRIDAGIASGDDVTVHYDPMLAKLIVYGEDRTSAVRRLAWLLDRVVVLGVATNIPLLRAIAAEPDFCSGDTTTAYLDIHELSANEGRRVGEPVALAAAGLWEASAGGRERLRHGRYNPWTNGPASGTLTERRVRYQLCGRDRLVSVRPYSSGDGYLVSIDGEPFPDGTTPITVLRRESGALTLAFANRREALYIARQQHDLLVAWRGENYILGKPTPLDVDSTEHMSHGERGLHTLVAPMAGTIIKVDVSEGAQVSAHQTLVVLGAMKMEHAISAPYAGRIVRVAHGPGDVVQGGQLLVELSAGEP